jgi:hypothetical protein
MEVIVFESQAFKEILNQLQEIKNIISTGNNHPANTWIDNDEFIRQLKISRRTAQTYRDNGVIGFSQIKNKIYYRQMDVLELLEKNFKKSRFK